MIAQAFLNRTKDLPPEILGALRNLIRRARFAIILRGACAVASVALASLLAVMAIDASVTLFSPSSRWMLSGIVYAASAAAFLWFIVHPLARTFTLAGMARLIETRHPEMQERLSSIVELLTSDDAPETRGSAELIEALKQEAIRAALVVRPKEEISIRAILPFVMAAGSLLVILALLFAILPRQTFFLLARAAAPFVNLPNVYAADLKVTPGDLLVGEGSRVEILVNVADLRVGAATLRKSGADFREDALPMLATTSAPGQDRAFSIAFPAVKETFHYRVHAGDALSRYYTVRVVPPPAVIGVGLTFTHPAYSGIPLRVETKSIGTIRDLAGTVVDVRARINKSVPSAAAVIQTPSASTNISGRIVREKDGQLAYSFRIELTPGLTGLWSIQLKDEFGLTNDKFERTIQALPDAVPTARILHLASQEIHLNPIETLPVIYAAADDLGIGSVELALDADGQKSQIPLTNSIGIGGLGKQIDGETEINLPDLSLCRASRITFQILARDTLPASSKGPQVGASQAFTIVIDANVPSFDVQVLNSQDQKLRQELQKVQQMLAEAQQNAQAAGESIERNKKLDDGAARQLDETQRKLAEADKALRTLAGEMKDTYYDKVSSRIDDLTQDHVERAHALADEVRLADKAELKAEKAGQTTAEVAAAAAAVQDIVKNLDELTPAAKRLLELVSLAARQKKLADLKLAMEQQQAAASPSKNPPPAAAANPLTKEEWQRAQDQVADELAKVAKLTPLVADDVRREVRKDAMDATAQADGLAQQQKELVTEVSRIADLQTTDKSLHDLAREQSILAVDAKTNPLVADHFDAMQKAAEAIDSDRIEAAIPSQMQIVEALTNRAEEIRHPLAPADQLAESQKVLDLQKKEQNLHKQVAEHADQRTKVLQDLAAQQVKLAAEARTNALTAPQADAMLHAADSIKAEQAQQAAREQEAIEKALAAAAGQVLKSALTPQQQQESQKAAGLAKHQTDLAKKVNELAEARTKVLQDLAREQEAAAAEASKLPDTAAAVKAMNKAADAIKTDQPRKAMVSQKNAAKELQKAAGKAKADKNATPQQQQAAQKLTDLAATEQALPKKLADIDEQRLKAVHELAAEEAKLAAEAMQNAATATQFEPMTKAAKALMANQPGVAIPKLEETAKALDEIAVQVGNVQPTPQQLVQASQIQDMQKKEEALRKKVNELNDQQHNAMAAIAADQEKLAAEARDNPRTATQADPMLKIAVSLKTDQPRQALPQQDAVEKNLANAADQLKLSPQPSPEQLQTAQAVAEVARKQDEIRKKAEQLQEQKQAEIKNLGTEQAKLAADAKADSVTAAQAGALQKAADAMRMGDLDKAREAQEQAGKAIAKAQAEIEHPVPTDEQKKTAQSVEKLADEQKDIHDRTAKLLKENREQLKELTKEQTALAVEAKSVPAAAPQVPAMRQAVAQLKNGQLSLALPVQEKAAMALKAAAAKIEANPKSTVAQKHDAQRLNELAEKQDDIVEKAEKMASEQARKLQTLATEQARLSEDAKALPSTAPQAVAMKQAADAIAQSKPADAPKSQQAAEKGLNATLSELRSPRPTIQQSQAAQKVGELEQRQEQLARKLDDYTARDRGVYAAAREEQFKLAQDLQKQVAEQAEHLSEMTRDVAPQADRLETHAAREAGQAVAKLGQQDMAEAARSATQAAADLDKLADRLENAARQRMTEAEAATRKNPESKEAEKAAKQVKNMMDLAGKAADTSKLEQQAAREINALASGLPINGLMEQQKTLSENAAALSGTASRLKEQSNDMELNPQARQQVQQASDSAVRAVQNANQAAKLIQDHIAAVHGKEPQPPLTAPLQQQIQQAQRQAAQEFASAAKAMGAAAEALDQPMAESSDVPPPNTNDEIPGAYEEARQAAQSQSALDALQASEAIRQAVGKAAEYAQTAGINSKPEHRQTMSSTGGGQNEPKDVNGKPPAWGAQVGMKLKNWLNLYGDLKDEVLQAQSEEGPEEYRGLIKRYFNEVSRRGGEEQ